MDKIKLVLLSWISATLDKSVNNSEIGIEKPGGENKSIKDVLNELALGNRVFNEKVFNSREQKLNQRVNILLNGTFISHDRLDAALNEGDILTLLSLSEGG